jgi:hypothetical protein
VQFDDAAAQGRALLAAAEAHMDALEHSVFAGEGGGGDGVPHFCCLSTSAGDAMACACAAAAAGACPPRHSPRLCNVTVLMSRD